jgi:pyrroloquinoline quinone (PQQ) biosynthesis protein C
MDLRHRLLDHPFYKAWTSGDITLGQLSSYHASYGEFIGEIPGYWKRVTEAFGQCDGAALRVAAEEKDHVRLWQRWGKNLPAPGETPGMGDLQEALERLTPSQLLGALHAFEIQQPEVARTKRECLAGFFGMAAEDLQYFDAHQDEERHIEYGRWLAQTHADASQFREGFDVGARLVYESLNRFVAA